MSRICNLCGKATTNQTVARYFNDVDPTEATWQALCDLCQQPRESPDDYAAPFADGEEEE